MAGQRMQARDKIVQKMTKDGLVEENLADKSTVRISSRIGDVQVAGKDGGKGENFSSRVSATPDFPRKEGRNGEQARDAPKRMRRAEKLEGLRQETEGGAVPKLSMDHGQGADGKLREKHAELSDFRGEAKKTKAGGSKKPRQKQRLRFDDGDTPKSLKEMESFASSNRTGEAASDLRHEAQKKRNKKIAFEEAKKKNPKPHSRLEQVYQEYGDSPAGKKVRLNFEEARAGAATAVSHASAVASAVAHREIGKREDDNAAVEGAHRLEESGESVFRTARERVRRHNRRKTGNGEESIRRQSQRKSRMTGYQANKPGRQAAKSRGTANAKLAKKRRNKLIQKKRIRNEYVKILRAGRAGGTAAAGTAGKAGKVVKKVAKVFLPHRKVFFGVALLIGLVFLIMIGVSSCSSIFMESVFSYAATSYLSADEEIRKAELYYTQLEADLQQRINQMETEHPGYDDYRYNIGEIGHDPFILISYLSAKYEEFTFNQVKGELDNLFALQYQLETEAVTETVTETVTVRVGESLGQVVTSGYCNCAICCGRWAGGPTASGVYPRANHTLAVDATNPFVPMGTKVVMNGVEYTVEDTGAFARYGVQFDVYYDNHAAASAHGHKTWECYLADDNGDREVEVTRTEEKRILNVTLNSASLSAICQGRLGIFKKELFAAYNETKGNLQMFGSPFAFNWYGSVSSYYGYRIHPTSGVNQLHNGLDIAVPEGTEVLSGMDGSVTESGRNDSYGNYVILKDSRGYELRYAHLKDKSVSAGDEVTSGTVIGHAGKTGNTTGTHLHIELLKDGARMNPIFYLETGEGAGFGGNEYTSDAAGRLLEEAASHLGTPYVWGGYSPSGFDCSGFVSYCLTHSGVRNTGRLTAQGLYNICTPVSESDLQPGDLVFFTGTYNSGVPVSHVGIYVGDGQMIHCGHPVQYTSIRSSYWQSHLYGFGRW